MPILGVTEEKVHPQPSAPILFFITAESERKWCRLKSDAGADDSFFFFFFLTRLSMHDACRYPHIADRHQVKCQKITAAGIRRRGGRFSAVQGKVCRVKKKKMSITKQTRRTNESRFWQDVDLSQNDTHWSDKTCWIFDDGQRSQHCSCAARSSELQIWIWLLRRAHPAAAINYSRQFLAELQRTRPRSPAPSSISSTRSRGWRLPGCPSRLDSSRARRVWLRSKSHVAAPCPRKYFPFREHVSWALHNSDISKGEAVGGKRVRRKVQQHSM